MHRHLAARGFAAALAVVSLSTAASAQGEVNLYTTREPGLIQPLLDAFTKDTKIKVNTIFIKDGLAERVKTEGANSPADMMMTVDIGNLLDTVDQGVTQAVQSEALSSAIPAHLRDKDGHWFALSLRARLIYASKERVKDTKMTYESLSDPKWKGKICIRSGQHMYNNALFAAYIAKHGQAKAEEWLKGVKANLAQKPSGGDREQARDVAAGKCDLGIGNTYYWALMTQNPAQKPWADATRVVLPVFEGGGTHVNLSGVVLARHAPNKANAMKLIEWLAGDEAQHLYADSVYEYPLVASVAVNPIVASYGSLKPDDVPLSTIGNNKKLASELVDKVGFDN